MLEKKERKPVENPQPEEKEIKPMADSTEELKEEEKIESDEEIEVIMIDAFTQTERIDFQRAR